MSKENRNSLAISKLAFFAVGGYLLWKNRFKIQELLESQGVKTPWMTDDVGEAVQSGAAKISGAAKRSFRDDSVAPIV